MDNVPEQQKLPWWTWAAPLPLIMVFDFISLPFQYSVTTSFYLTASISLVLVHWLGPQRVLPAVFIVNTYNNYFYGIDNLALWPLFGLTDTMSVFSSWFLFTHLYKGKYYLPDTRNTSAFAILGLLTPILISVSAWQFLYVADNKLLPENIIWQFSRDLLGELIVHSILVVPALYYLSPYLSQKKWIQNQQIPTRVRRKLSGRSKVVIAVVLVATSVAAFTLDFKNFWFVFGFISLFIAIQFGFGVVVLANVLIFFLTYFPPAISSQLFSMVDYQTDEEVLRTFFAYFLLYVFSTMTGRVISDLRQAKEQLRIQNEELKQTNAELDRFVYSVSHDLTAPLKSILGLVNVSRMVNPNAELISYLNKIQTSVLKLEGFIKDILNYSRNNRIEVVKEEIDLYEMCNQIVEAVKFHHLSHNVNVDLSGTENQKVISDRSRLLIILNNIITNAIKYQKRNDNHKPQVKIYLIQEIKSTAIVVEDNGEGIPPEVLPQIFKMFFRGSLGSQGSGLGLYIAKGACEKIGGKILVESELGKGSRFTVKLNN
jgi:signal transduction histidine kinase